MCGLLTCLDSIRGGWDYRLCAPLHEAVKLLEGLCKSLKRTPCSSNRSALKRIPERHKDLLPLQQRLPDLPRRLCYTPSRSLPIRPQLSRHWERRPRRAQARRTPPRLTPSFPTPPPLFFFSGVRSDRCRWPTPSRDPSEDSGEVDKMEGEAGGHSQRAAEGGRSSEEEPPTGGSVK